MKTTRFVVGIDTLGLLRGVLLLVVPPYGRVPPEGGLPHGEVDSPVAVPLPVPDASVAAPMPDIDFGGF